MSTLCLVLALAFLVCIILGIINPRLVIFWGNRTNRSGLWLYVLLSAIFFGLMLAFPPNHQGILSEALNTCALLPLC